MKVLFVPAAGGLDNATLLRCQAALNLWSSGDYDVIICSGGIELPNTVASAVLMKKWFESKGISRIIAEGDSLDSFQNIRFCLGHLKEARSVTIVSQWQHCFRLKLILRLGYGVKARCHLMWYIRSWKKALFVEPMYLLYVCFDPTGKGILPRIHRAIDGRIR